MLVQVEDGRIRRIEPHTGNRATPQGVSLKGLSYVERQHSADRILHPLQETGSGFGGGGGAPAAPGGGLPQRTPLEHGWVYYVNNNDYDQGNASRVVVAGAAVGVSAGVAVSAATLYAIEAPAAAVAAVKRLPRRRSLGCGQ